MKHEQTEKVTLEFEYFIKMAFNKKMSWSTLEHLLTDLATNPTKSKQIIKTLLQELLEWVSKVESSKLQNENHYSQDKKTNVIIENNDKPVDNEESYKNTTALMDESEKSAQDIELVFEKYELTKEDQSKADFQSEETEKKDFKPIVDFNPDEFYEFVGSLEEQDQNESLPLESTEYKIEAEIHEKTDIEEKPYQCMTCKQSFSASSILKQHERIHVKILLPYNCKICKKSFSKKHNLNVHYRTHNDERPFECKTCPNRFRQMAHLQRHQNTH